jgi:UDP-glucuronate decarboxylase
MSAEPMSAEPMSAGLRNGRDVVGHDLADIGSRLDADFASMDGGRLLIVGGGGFLGYYLVQSVLHWNRTAARPVPVTVFDNYSRGVPRWLEDLRGDPHLELRRHDVRDPYPADAPEADYIVHAASIASPKYYRLHPIETMDANVDGLRNLLDHANARRDGTRPVRGFLYFSTSEIYGDPTPDQIPTPETYRGNVSCTGPRACYDESKRYGETLCVNFARAYGLPVKVARPFNNYGPGLKITDARVLPDFARDVMNGRDIVMHSDGSPTRTFCYIADAVVGYYRILLRGRPGEAYNVGTESPEISMADLAEMVVATARDLFGYRGSVVRRPSDDAAYLVDNPNRRCPVIAKARTELGYEPLVGLADGLRRSLLWYHDHPEAEEA